MARIGLRAVSLAVRSMAAILALTCATASLAACPSYAVASARVDHHHAADELAPDGRAGWKAPCPCGCDAGAGEQGAAPRLDPAPPTSAPAADAAAFSAPAAGVLCGAATEHRCELDPVPR